MRSAALEYARHGITINAIQPGNILTEGLQAQGDTYLEQMKAAISHPTPSAAPRHRLRRRLFAARENAYITGQALVVDAARFCRNRPEALL